jgi:hypothetical protein
MPLLNTPNSENQAINTPLSEQKPAKFEKSRLNDGDGSVQRIDGASGTPVATIETTSSVTH